MNYKEDDSFFTTVFPPFVYYGWSIKSWLLNDQIAKFRYIRDHEAEQEFWNIEQINEIYPEVKSISIIVNPWARVRYSFEQLCIMKNNNAAGIKNLSQMPLDSFSKFVNNLSDLPQDDDLWFSITTPMSRWIDYESDGKLRTVDYILKDETFESDFRKIQEYFCSDKPLNIPKIMPCYKEFYNKKNKDVVADIFKEDIDRFGYEF